MALNNKSADNGQMIDFNKVVSGSIRTDSILSVYSKFDKKSSFKKQQGKQGQSVNDLQKTPARTKEHGNGRQPMLPIINSNSFQSNQIGQINEIEEFCL